MKILQVVPYMSPVYGGPTHAVRQMKTALARAGVSVDVVTTTAGYAETDVSAAPGTPPKDAGAHYFPWQFPKSWYFSKPLGHWLASHLDGYDLAHVHVPFCYPSYRACALAKARGVPYIISTHGVLDPWDLAQKKWKKLPYYYLLERRNLRAARIIHATSAFEAKGLSGLGFAHKTVVIPLAVDLPPLEPRSDGPGEGLKLLFLSRLHPVKGLPVLLGALKLVLDRGIAAQLEIAGTGDPAYIDKLKHRVRALGLSHVVRFSGFLQARAKALSLAGADVFVLPSYHESFSVATLEALAAGMPVIVTDQVALAEEIRSAGAGLVVAPGSEESLADALGHFKDRGERRAAGEKSRALAEQKFNPDILASSLVACYQSAIAAGRSDG